MSGIAGIAGTTRLRGKKPITWRTILGLVLVPLTIAGVFLWGLWNPEERLNTVTAAVVNLDEPVEMDGQLVPLGRVLAGELIGSDAPESAEGTGNSGGSDGERTNFDWILTDEADAETGLENGTYATVITIPENFSAAATSLSDGPDAAEQATIDIATTDRGRLLDGALSGIVTQAATSVVNEQLGTQFVGNIFVGMTEIGDGISEAADGAEQLADGGSQLADGADEFVAGTGELADGTSQLADGTSQLAAGTGELAAAAGELAGGATGIADGAEQLASGASAYAGGVDQFAAETRTAADGSAELADGIAQYAAGVNQMAGEVLGGTGALSAQLGDVRAAIASGLIPMPSEEDKAAALGTIDAMIEGLGGAGEELTRLQAAGNQLADGARKSADGSAQLAGVADGLAAGARDLANGAGELAGGAQQFAGGVGAFSSGVGELATGANELAAGAGELSSGMPTLVEGAEQLADGTRQTADGAGELASGLGTAADEIPNYSESDRERMAKVAVAPVSGEGGPDELFNASGVPLFVGIALWAGALAVFMMLAPLWRRTLEAAQGVGALTVRSALPALVLGAVQGAIAGIVLPLMLGYSADQGLQFFGFALVAGVAFAFVVQGLSALFGGLGRFVAFVLLMIAFAVGVVSTVPGPLAAIGDASPIGAAFSGFQSIAVGVSGAGPATFLLIVWGLAGLAMTALAIGRARRARPATA